MDMDKVHYNGGYACEFCGRLGASLFGGRHVCSDCGEGMSSCCPEFGTSEPWSEEDFVQEHPQIRATDRSA